MPETSRHEVLVYRALKRYGGWATNRELASAIGDGVALRTVRAYTARLVQIGVVEQAELFPANKYRLVSASTPQHREYRERLQRSASVLGVKL